VDLSKIKRAGLLGLIMVVLHATIGTLLTDDLTSNIALLAVNMFVFYIGHRMAKTVTASTVGIYMLGYFLLFILFFGFLDSPSLFMLFTIAYAATFHRPLLRGFFIIFTISLVLFQPYWKESFIILAMLYTALFQTVSKKHSKPVVVLLGIGLVFLAFLMMPVLTFLFHDSPQTLRWTFSDSQVRQAIFRTLWTATLSSCLVFIFGVPLAYGLARTEFSGKKLLSAVIDLPILIPHSVVGICLLLFLGPRSPVGTILKDQLGLSVAGTWIGIIVAQMFVSFPFIVKTAMGAFEAVPVRLEEVAMTLGAGPWQAFFRVMLPQTGKNLFVGYILAWARAVSEFGSIILIAPRPFTAPVLVYEQFLQYGVSQARPVAILLVVICLWVFILAQLARPLLPGNLLLKERKTV
jgi:molybdate/tungstate transport system permease protein